jgi:hypothetical protein
MSIPLIQALHAILTPAIRRPKKKNKKGKKKGKKAKAAKAAN